MFYRKHTLESITKFGKNLVFCFQCLVIATLFQTSVLNFILNNQIGTVLNKGLKEQMKKMNQLATAFTYIENIKSTKTFLTKFKEIKYNKNN